MGAGPEDYSPNGSYIFQDDVTWIHGKHTLPLRLRLPKVCLQRPRLSVTPEASLSAHSRLALPGFTSETGDAFASFLLGGANNASQNIAGYTSGFRQPEHGLYVMDDWKITPRLTMNLGFRWEIIPPLYEVTNRMSEVSLSVPDPGAGNRPGRSDLRRTIQQHLLEADRPAPRPCLQSQ